MEAFGHIAENYDGDFVFSETGKLQRDRVWQYLDETLGGLPLRILELNCGTGEDALRLAAQGHNVVATDISEGMITVARRKAEKRGFGGKLRFKVLDMKNLNPGQFDHQFDIVFSNFGGMNCLSDLELRSLLNILPRVVGKHGKIIFVIMSRFCAWESMYFISRLKFGKAFRRLRRKAISVDIGPGTVDVVYYSPGEIRSMAGTEFRLKSIMPVGFFLPPSYLEPFFSKRPKLLRKLSVLEERWAKGRLTASMSDHFLIDIERVK